MNIVVTGAAGLIGSNIVKALNEKGISNILAVDNLTDPRKFLNLVDCDIADYFPKDEFRLALSAGSFDGEISAILHQGACSNTMETDGGYVMDNNYRYSSDILAYCQQEAVPLIYASSAAVYGGSNEFSESRKCEMPINVYGYSKFLFDQLVRRRWEDNTAQVVGLRYFNVYGPRESHKDNMASVGYHLFNQYTKFGQVNLFQGSGGYRNGEQERDFVSVIDAVALNLWFLENQDKSGIFNCGTGTARSFNSLAVATINACRKRDGEENLSLEEILQKKILKYIPFPDDLLDKYQNFTEADTSKLTEIGYDLPFLDLESGIDKYVQWLVENSKS
ncbi:MAG: ADP-glyceromanno-heptose 6-epimerase [Proteobacteria bacterium]|nr:ADP-glyceromanno-heptose 6-epimerase [Pseudomonadota bacterium]